MIFDREDPERLEQVSWLALARAQSLRLADARAGQSRPWRSVAPPTDRLLASHPIRWAMAGALAFLLIASGAWALVAQTKPAASNPPVPPSLPAAIRALPPGPAPAPAKPTPPARATRRKEKKSLPPRAKSLQPLKFEEGDGELILVAPHEPLPPLFSPEEWKRRGSPSQP